MNTVTSFSKPYQLKVLACIICAMLVLAISLSAQTTPVTFRFADPQKLYVRAFVPGEFNNWGPNSGGAIIAGAPSEMSYDAASGAWTKTLQLNLGKKYLYKFQYHTNQSGSQYTWTPDPLNDVQEGNDQNSALQVSNFFVFQPALDTNAQGTVTAVNASIVGASTVTRLSLVIDNDSTNVLPTFNTSTRLLRYTLPSPQPRSRTYRIVASDNAGNALSYTFLSFINAVPSWAKDVVWYQIFPERFRNGDKSNDPTRESLELGNGVSDKWRVKDWGSDWFTRDDWEKEFGSSFYTNAIFHRRYGGDIQGMIDKLDYLKDLGITALYLNPMFYANSLHKYDGNAHHHIDPYFGPNPKADLEQIARENASAAPYDPKTWKWTSADSLFLKFLGEAKKRGLRVIIDGVFNHTGRRFYAFQDLQKNQQASRFKDWYVVNKFDDPATPQNEFAYKSWEGFTSLPEFARSADGRTLADAPKQYIFDITKRWMDPNGDGDPSDGIDGWRLDVVPYMPTPFWNEWNAYVRRLNPNAYTTAEIWTDASPATVKNGNFSAVMNYWAFTLPVKDFFVNQKGTAQDFWKTMEQRRSAYSPDVQAVLQNMMDSHDTERLSSMTVNNTLSGITNNAWGRPSYQIRKPTQPERDLQKLIALFQATYVGAPMLYYGTESGLWGGNDPDDRMPMNWEDITFAPQAASHSPAFTRPVDDMNFDKGLSEFYKQLLQSKKYFSASLREQPLTKLETSNNNVLVLMRFYPGRSIINQVYANSGDIVIFNLTSDTASTTINAGPFEIIRPDLVLGNLQIKRQNQMSFSIILAPLSGAIVHGADISSVSVDKQNFPTRAYPQPFSESTTIEYTLESATQVSMTVYDALGRVVLVMDEGWQAQGSHMREVVGATWAQGTYFCTVKTSTGAVQRVLLVKQ